jgi:predicted O-methyltransferase YrrM
MLFGIVSVYSRFGKATIMKTDPFTVKKHPKWHLGRLAFTIKARLLEWESRRNFGKYALPPKLITCLPPDPKADYANTAVTPIQMQHLLYALAATEPMIGTVVVELGCCRGVTTQVLARATSRRVIAVDPYIGYGGNMEDFRIFRDNVAGLPNVIHERATSGEAVRTWEHGPVSFSFIDAVHDYVNTAFDMEAWSSKMVKGGIMAVHDTDQLGFAGTRKSVFEFCRRAQLFAHPDNLTVITLGELETE